MTAQRLDRVENDLDAVRQLLASAATYAESANRRTEQQGERIDQLTQAQQQTQSQLDQMGERVDQLAQAQNRTEATLDRLGERFDQLAQAQNRTEATLDRLGERVDRLTQAQEQTQSQLNQMKERDDQLSSRMDEFVFQVQRIFNQQATVLERADGRAERLEAIVQRLDRNYVEQQSQFQEFQRTTNAALERIDRVLDYLLRQQGGNTPG